MELYQLHYFMAVAKYNNITKAAQELGIGQPAVSKAIQALESELQLKLLIREGRSISLTHHGKLLRMRLKPLLHELEGLPSEIRLFGVEKEVVKINVLSCSLLLTEIIKEFREVEPETIFTIVDQREGVDWDLSLRSTLPGISYSNGQAILEEELFLASGLGSWLDNKDLVSLNQLEKEIFVMLSRDSQIRSLSKAFFQEAGLVPNIVYECDSPEMVQRLVEGGLGVTLWPQYAWGGNEKVKLTPLKEDMRRTIHLLWKEELNMDRAWGRFAKYFIDNVDRFI